MDVYDSLVALNSPHLRHFVFVTGGAFTPQAQEFIIRVNATVLTKPLDLAELEELVQKYTIKMPQARSSDITLSVSALYHSTIPSGSSQSTKVISDG